MPNTRCQLLLLAILVGSIFSARVRADTLRVPADYPTIQAAIDAASDGDEILIAPGEYHERPIARNKSLTIRGELGSAETTIDADAVGTVFEASDCEWFTIQGLTLQNGHAYGALLSRVRSVAFDDVRLGGNGYGGGRIQADTVDIRNSSASYNRWTGLDIECTTLFITGLDLSHNRANRDAAFVFRTETFEITDCRFVDNDAVFDFENQIPGMRIGRLYGSGRIERSIFTDSSWEEDNFIRLLPPTEGHVLFRQCRFDSNIGSNNLINMSDGTASFEDCKFTQNRVFGSLISGRITSLVGCSFLQNERIDRMVESFSTPNIHIEDCFFGAQDCQMFLALGCGITQGHIIDSQFCGSSVFPRFFAAINMCVDNMVIDGCSFQKLPLALYKPHSDQYLGVRNSWFCAVDEPIQGEWDDLGGNEFCDLHPADFNADGRVDEFDIYDFVVAWQNADPATDLDLNSQIDTRDLIAYLNLWTECF